MFWKEPQELIRFDLKLFHNLLLLRSTAKTAGLVLEQKRPQRPDQAVSGRFCSRSLPAVFSLDLATKYVMKQLLRTRAAMLDVFIYIVIGFWLCYAFFRTVRGRIRFKILLVELEGEGIVLSERFVFTRFNFPMIKRITFSHAFLTRSRFVIVHWLSRNMILQAPLGPEGRAGTEKGRFEAERRGKKARLLLRTTIRGGGRVRFHLKKPDEWLRGIRTEG
jgi:hypothetical protein